MNKFITSLYAYWMFFLVCKISLLLLLSAYNSLIRFLVLSLNFSACLFYLHYVSCVSVSSVFSVSAVLCLLYPLFFICLLLVFMPFPGCFFSWPLPFFLYQISFSFFSSSSFIETTGSVFKYANVLLLVC